MTEKPLAGKTALVTGGTRGIGRAVSLKLASQGAAIILNYLRDEEQAHATCAEVESLGGEVSTLKADLSDVDAIHGLFDAVRQRNGGLDILVNCAALVGTSDLKGWTTPFEQQDSTTWRLALEVNLTSAFVLVQSCTETLRKSGHASIINIASIYGLVGPDLAIYENTEMGNPAAYAVSKGGLLQLTRWLATVLSPSIRVNAVTLGGILRNQPASFQERYFARTPLRRLATEDEVKGAVAYLASDLSSYVTGHNLVVDGGWTIW